MHLYFLFLIFKSQTFLGRMGIRGIQARQVKQAVLDIHHPSLLMAPLHRLASQCKLLLKPALCNVCFWLLTISQLFSPAPWSPFKTQQWWFKYTTKVFRKETQAGGQYIISIKSASWFVLKLSLVYLYWGFAFSRLSGGSTEPGGMLTTSLEKVFTIFITNKHDCHDWNTVRINVDHCFTELIVYICRMPGGESWILAELMLRLWLMNWWRWKTKKRHSLILILTPGQ